MMAGGQRASDAPPPQSVKNTLHGSGHHVQAEECIGAQSYLPRNTIISPQIAGKKKQNHEAMS